MICRKLPTTFRLPSNQQKDPQEYNYWLNLVLRPTATKTRPIILLSSYGIGVKAPGGTVADTSNIASTTQLLNMPSPHSGFLESDRNAPSVVITILARCEGKTCGGGFSGAKF